MCKSGYDFLLQYEGGIRGLSWCRGVGDVYERRGDEWVVRICVGGAAVSGWCGYEWVVRLGVGG